MKKFTIMILCVSTFFVGLGGLVESVGARFKSDERALEIMRQARQAIGGDANIKAMQALTVKGKASKTFEFENVARIERGEWELNLQLPNKMSKMMKIETENIVGNTNTATIDKTVDVVVVRKADGTQTETVIADSPQKITIVKKGEGGNVITEDMVNTNGETIKFVGRERINAENFQRNELFRTMIGLFLTPPQGIDADYVYAGETNIDGINCEIVQISGGGSSVKLFINKSTHLPVMMSYTDAKPRIFTFTARSDSNVQEVQGQKIEVQSVQDQAQVVQGQKITLNRAEAQVGEFQIKFSDYRTVNGLQLPFKWSQTIDGKADETIEVSAYEFNPLNIGEKFKELPQKIMIRTEKP